MSSVEAQLSFEEGKRYVAYPDTLTGAAPYTIGKGHTGPEVHLGLVWDDNQIDYAFQLDVATATQGCLNNFGSWFGNLNEPRQAVLIALAYQMGISKLLQFHNTLAYAESGRYFDAAQGLRSSVWANETPARAEREAKQFETGQWDPHYA